MADQKISELTQATSVTSTDVVPLVQSGVTKKVSIATLFSTVPVRVVETELPVAVTSGVIPTAGKMNTLSAPTTNVSYTLAAGNNGEYKELVATNIGNTFTATVTVSSARGFSSVVFSSTGQSVTLKFIDGYWYVMSYYGVTITV